MKNAGGVVRVGGVGTGRIFNWAHTRAFLRAAKEIVGFQGHIGYELCSPVLIDHRHAGLDYALLQAELACEYMRHIIDSL